MAGTNGLEPAASAVTGGDCQTLRESHKATRIVGWAVGLKSSGQDPAGQRRLPEILTRPFLEDILHDR
jgi:hypothetical protein